MHLPSFLRPPGGGLPSRRWWLRALAINAGITVAVFGLIQLIPVNRGNPSVEREPVWVSPEVRALAQDACFACHSNETDWPWYARIAPVSWITWYDVTEGRQRLNFSDWDHFVHADFIDPTDPFPEKTLSEKIAHEIRSGNMPPGTYQLMHSEARLTDAEKEMLIEGLIQTVKQNQEQP